MSKNIKLGVFVPFLIQCAVRVLPPEPVDFKKRPNLGSQPVIYDFPIESQWLRPSSQRAYMVLRGLDPHLYEGEIHFRGETVDLYLNGEFVKTIEKDRGGAYKIILKDDSTYHFDLRHRGQVVDSWMLKTPRDLVLTSENLKRQSTFVNNKDLRFFANRVFLSKRAGEDGFYQTRGQTLIIWGDEILTDDAHIETFREGAKAQAFEAGRDGGLVVLKAKRARGDLYISVRGEAGGNTISGCDRLRGGNSGRVNIEISEKSPHFKLEVEAVGGLDGGYFEKKISTRDFESWVRGGEKSCHRKKLAPRIGVGGIIQHQGLSEAHCISIGEGFGRCF